MARVEHLLFAAILCLLSLATPSAADVLRPWAPMEMVVFQSDEVAVVRVARAEKPEEKELVLPEGRTDDVVPVTLDLRKGRWTFTGGYESGRDGRAADGTPLWTGKLKSPAAEVEVTKSEAGR